LGWDDACDWEVEHVVGDGLIIRIEDGLQSKHSWRIHDCGKRLAQNEEMTSYCVGLYPLSNPWPPRELDLLGAGNKPSEWKVTTGARSII